MCIRDRCSTSRPPPPPLGSCRRLLIISRTVHCLLSPLPTFPSRSSYLLARVISSSPPRLYSILCRSFRPPVHPQCPSRGATRSVPGLVFGRLDADTTVLIGEEKVTMKIVDHKFAQDFDLKPVDLQTVSLNDLHILPCLSQAAMGGGKPPHRARYHFVSYLADRFRMCFPAWRVGDKEKEEHIRSIVSICQSQEWVDYRYEKTEEQVRSIVMTGYSHATCSTLYMEGFCMGKCKYYDGTGVDA